MRRNLPTLNRMLLSAQEEFGNIRQYWIINLDTCNDITFTVKDFNLDITNEEAQYVVVGEFNKIPIYASDIIMYGNPYELTPEIEKIIKNKIITDNNNWGYTDINEDDKTYEGMSDMMGMRYFESCRASLGKPTNIAIIRQIKPKNGTNK